MLAGFDPFHEGEGRHQTDCPMSAHPEITDIIKEDDTCGAGGIFGLA
jgi:hypothetical protein